MCNSCTHTHLSGPGLTVRIWQYNTHIGFGISVIPVTPAARHPTMYLSRHMFSMNSVFSRIHSGECREGHAGPPLPSVFNVITIRRPPSPTPTPVQRATSTGMQNTHLQSHFTFNPGFAPRDPHIYPTHTNPHPPTRWENWISAPIYDINHFGHAGQVLGAELCVSGAKGLRGEKVMESWMSWRRNVNTKGTWGVNVEQRMSRDEQMTVEGYREEPYICLETVYCNHLLLLTVLFTEWRNKGKSPCRVHWGHCYMTMWTSHFSLSSALLEPKRVFNVNTSEPKNITCISWIITQAASL